MFAVIHFMFYLFLTFLWRESSSGALDKSLGELFILNRSGGVLGSLYRVKRWYVRVARVKMNKNHKTSKFLIFLQSLLGFAREPLGAPRDSQGPMGPQIVNYPSHQAPGPDGKENLQFGDPWDLKFGIFFPWSSGAGDSIIRPHIKYSVYSYHVRFPC